MGRPARGTNKVRSGRTPRDRYQLVFLLLITSYLLSAFVSGSPARSVTIALYLAALLIALRSSQLPRVWAVRLGWCLVAGSVAAAAADLVWPGRIVEGFVALWLATILLVTVIVVVWRVVHHEVVTLQTIFGGLSAYLLIGFFFASVYTVIGKFDTQPLFAGGQPVVNATVQYFSFTTLTTIGYGDVTAASDAGRALAVMEGLLGQIFLVTLVARLVSVFGTVRRPPARDSREHAADPPGPPAA
jgi:voltage-gated potassium channel Kch